MTFLLNDSATFAVQAAKGFALAHERGSPCQWWRRPDDEK